MRFTLSLGLPALLATSTLASVFESLGEVPQGWHNIGVAASDKRLKFHIVMNEPNEGLFEQTLYQISDPKHPRYGRHLKRDQLKALLRPNNAATQAVISWLQEHEIRDIVDGGEIITFVAQVADVEDLLQSRFEVYRSGGSQGTKEIIRTLAYSVPDGIQKHIAMIQPTTRFGQIHSQASGIRVEEELGHIDEMVPDSPICNSTITPSCLRALYNISNYTLNSNTTGFAAFNNFLDGYPRYADLSRFEAEYFPQAQGQNYTWTGINGGLNDQNSTAVSNEANLDLQYLLSTGWPVPIHAYSTGGLGPLDPDLDQPTQPGSNEPYLDFLTYILALPDDELPHTLSTSYGENEQSVPLSYRQSVCNMFGQLGARGVSVLFSSGDEGPGSACQSNDGTNTTQFLPTFPAACPYVTSVGATRSFSPESAAYFSAGGFSNTWSRPSYQDEAVTAYLEILGEQWDGLYNKTGRGFPDVAAQGYEFRVVDKAHESIVYGTSASTPVFAGVVALLNALRIQAGQSPLGFLNPWLYSEGYKGLTDIVNGGSKGCFSGYSQSGLPAPKVPYASWNATVSWDPVTGHGTPDFQKLLALAVNNATSNFTSAR